MFETTVKKFFPEHGYGFLRNPEPEGKDIYFRAKQTLKCDDRVVVLRQEGEPERPRAAKWREVKKK